jgi:multidrug efflux pump subunit AcrB
MFTAWLAAHRRSLLFLLLPIVAGTAAAFSLPVTLFPNVSFPRVRLTLEAGDRPAEQMVLQVTAPIEEAVHRVPHVTDVRSATSRGTAELSVFFAWGTDMVSAMLQVNAVFFLRAACTKSCAERHCNGRRSYHDMLQTGA